MVRLTVAVVLALCAAVAGCGGEDDEVAARPTATATPSTGPAGEEGVDVRVTMAEAPGPASYTARCEDAACVRRWRRLLERRDDGLRACTEIYGGPQKARVVGTVGGERVDEVFSRQNGCAIADYEALFELLGRPAPVG